MSLLTPEMKSLVGTSRTYIAPEPLGQAASRYFSLAIGDLNPIYSAQGIAPPTLICETNQYANLPMDKDGYAGHSWGLEIPNTRLVRGGNSYKFYQHIRTNDIIEVTWTVDQLSERVSSKGLAMVTMISTAAYRNHKQELLASNTESLIWVEIPVQK
ncbi:MAG: hypothetical protein CK518_00610 [Actinobacteria bacterium]|nr:MAG: hypothetical protein CK518_00610 [Actinomycetota bacterium]